MLISPPQKTEFSNDVLLEDLVKKFTNRSAAAVLAQEGVVAIPKTTVAPDYHGVKLYGSVAEQKILATPTIHLLLVRCADFSPPKGSRISPLFGIF